MLKKLEYENLIMSFFSFKIYNLLTTFKDGYQ